MKKNTLAFVSFLGILVVIGVAHFLLDRLGAGILSAVLLAAWLLWFVPKWQVDGHAAVIAPEDRPETENEFRRTMVQLVGGAAVLTGLFFTWQQLVATRETLQLAQSGRISDRLSRSIEQLGNASMHVRLGGLYGLPRRTDATEAVARDYARLTQSMFVALEAKEGRPEAIDPRARLRILQYLDELPGHLDRIRMRDDASTAYPSNRENSGARIDLTLDQLRTLIPRREAYAEVHRQRDALASSIAVERVALARKDV